MARHETEVAFLAGFWAATQEKDLTYARKIAANIEPDHLGGARAREFYRVLLGELEQGNLPDPGEAEFVLGLFRRLGDTPEAREFVVEVQNAALFFPIRKVGQYCREILDASQAQRLGVLLGDASKGIGSLLGEHQYAEASRYAGEIAMRLLAIQAERPGRHPIRTREEWADELIQLVQGEIEAGIPFPFWKLQNELGFIRPGMVVGITGESGAGKSTILGNFFNGWTTRLYPCLLFSTEMGKALLARAHAARARIPQIVAEGGLFKSRDPRVLEYLARKWGVDEATVKVRLTQYAEQFQAVAQEWRELPWELFDQPRLTLDDMIGHIRLARKRYAGQHVLVLVDHMLNLAYPDPEKPWAYVGEATRRIREVCQEDNEGGLSAVLLFQPRKVERGREREAAYRPVNAGAIQGNVKSVLDLHFSPYLRFVETQEWGRTDWGTKPCKLDGRGKPLSVPISKGMREPEGVKTDDEHVYLKPDKNRTGGESLTVMLDFHAPSGQVYEASTVRQEVAHAS